MVDRYGIKWNREETILAFDLYCKIPFAKISKSNKDIIALAEVIGRTPSSVGLKMSNLAHYDPNLIASNTQGMSHTSSLDEEIVKEFYDNWEELSYQAQLILAKYKHIDIKTLNPDIDSIILPEGINIETETKARIGQSFFRKAVLMAYSNSCCITGIRKAELLVASHIKPWNVSDEKTERTNPRNGLCLNALHDKAFDRGLITIDNSFKIRVSSKMSDVGMDKDTQKWFWTYDKKQIFLPDKFIPDKKFIEYHNDVIFLR